MKRIPGILIALLITIFMSTAWAAEQPYVEGEVIVKYKTGVSELARQSGIMAAGAVSTQSLDLIKAHRVRLPKGTNVPAALARFKSDPDVLYAEPNYIVHAAAAPNDPQYASQWALPMINAPAAWNTQTSAAAIVIAVLDSGMQNDHPDLAANMWNDGSGNFGYDFVNNDNTPYDDFGHGTMVAGVIGAVGNNGVGVTGVAWSTQLMAVKVLDATGTGDIATIVQGIGYAVAHGARAINSSYAYPGDGCSAVAFDQAERDAIVAARDAGVIIVAAAGNFNCNSDTLPTYPASYDLDNVIAVAATTQTDLKSSYSNYGATTVHLGAPGDAILSTAITSTYTTESGTSFSAPFVTGTLALVMAKHPGYTYKQAREALLLGAAPNTSLAAVTITGGRLDASNALTHDLPSGIPAPPSHTKATRSARTATLKWVDNSTVETAYMAEISVGSSGTWDTLSSSITANAQTYTADLPSYAEGTEYHFRLSATNANGSSLLSQASLTTPPNAPSALSARPTSNTTASLSWTNNTAIGDTINIYISTDGANFSQYGSPLASTATTADLSGLMQGTTYYLKVASHSGTYGQSDYSNTTAITTLGTSPATGNSGGGSGGGGGGGCFIATAANGDAHAPDVETLREFRDKILMRSETGRKFVSLYYQYSPPIAARIAGRPALMFAVRAALKPLVLATRHPMPALALALLAPFALLGLKRPRRLGRKGFTLLEIIVVVFILSLLAAIVAPKFMGRTDDAKVTEARVQIRNFETALKLYRIDNGSYPTSEQGLDALINKPSTGKIPTKYRDGGYLEQTRIPQDPWGNPYIYASPGSSGDYDIISLGADGKEGGENYNKDIKSWDMN